MTTRYYISFDGAAYSEFWPSNEPVIKYEQEAGEIFFRKKIDRFKIGKLKNPTIYSLLESAWFDPLSHGVQITFRIDIDSVTKFQFYDTVRCGTLNLDTKTFECTPDPDDSYKPILSKYSKKWDNRDGKLFLLDTAPYYPQLDTTGVFISSNFSVFNDITGSVSYTNTLTGAAYALKTLNVAAINGTVVTVIIKNLVITAGAGPTMRFADTGGGTGYSNQINITANGKYELLLTGIGHSIIELAQVNLGASSSGSFTYEVYASITPSDAGGGTLYSVLNRLLNYSSYFDLSYDIVSTIIWNDALESDPPDSINTYITANPTKDYVLESTAILNHLWLIRTDCFTTAKDDNIELSLKDILDILKVKRIYWFIDNNGKFRLEHEKYFRSYDPQLDLTSSSFNKPEIDRKAYSFDLDLYNQINLIENNAVNEDWIDNRIEYDPLITGSGIRDVRCDVTTDLKNIIDNAVSISSGGLMLLRADANDCIPLDESLVTPGNYYPNQKLSPAWMKQYYMDYFAEAQSGLTHTFIHVKESVKQTGIKFHSNPDMDWKKPFTLAIGNGWLTSAEYFPMTGWYNINVGYNPYDVNNTEAATGGSTTADSTLITVDSTLITADS